MFYSLIDLCYDIFLRVRNDYFLPVMQYGWVRTDKQTQGWTDERLSCRGETRQQRGLASQLTAASGDGECGEPASIQ